MDEGEGREDWMRVGRKRVDERGSEGAVMEVEGSEADKT